ncbi:winged helix-turn-helix transcriptional regulator [Methanoregula sp. PtaB.Bin085]|uniref:winged helix-turn-helix transcriptional regulator n=2 Tax=unclassified Methanoregula TaxID=2649730 RepID=UPI0025BE90FC|nr:winged helix-turn-helix transcriptional regulator [Methanoregula sp. PtaB.Bin085]
MQEPPEDTSQEVSFYELTPRAMIIFVALSFSPILVYPVEFFLMIKIFVYLGYRKIDEMAVLYNSNRRLIFETVARNPGINFNTLMISYGINRGVLQYHLHILELKGKIVRFHTAKSEGYFENSGRWGNLEKCIFIHMRNSTTKKILGILSDSREITRKEIAEILGVSGPSITWHTNRLSEDGIITITRNGRDASFRLSHDAARSIRGLSRALQSPVFSGQAHADQAV